MATHDPRPTTQNPTCPKMGKRHNVPTNSSRRVSLSSMMSSHPLTTLSSKLETFNFHFLFELELMAHEPRTTSLLA